MPITILVRCDRCEETTHAVPYRSEWHGTPVLALADAVGHHGWTVDHASVWYVCPSCHRSEAPTGQA